MSELPEVTVDEITVSQPPYIVVPGTVYVNVKMRCDKKEFGRVMMALGVQHTFGGGRIGYPVFSDETGLPLGWVQYINGEWVVGGRDD